MPLSPGSTLCPYAVTAKIGEGGMGEVYRARDTKLDRDMTLKVLPPAFADDPDRLARFERETKDPVRPETSENRGQMLMSRTTTLTSLVVLGAVAVVVALRSAQQPIGQIERVKENLYLLNGARAAPGTNSTTVVFVAATGVVVVDTQIPGWGQAILDQVRSVTDKPVTMIINTHTHGDHVGSNAEFPDSVEIVAHEHAESSMARMRMFEGENARYLPSQTFSERMSLLEGEDRIDLYHFGRAHTPRSGRPCP